MHFKSNGSIAMTNVKVDLGRWPWPWYITAQHVQLYEIQLYAKYKVSMCNSLKVIFDLYIWPLTLCDDLKDDTDLEISLLNMCSSLRYTCMPNIKSLFLLVQKLWLVIKMTLKDDLDLDTSPINMYCYMRYTCMPHIKFLCVIVVYFDL